MRTRRLLPALVILFGYLFSSIGMALPEPLIPDPKNQGALCDEQDKDFLEYRYAEEIPYCERNVSGRMKTLIYQDYGIDPECRYQYTIDHFYPLSLGGDNSRDNLWPEHRNIKRSRMNLENDLFKKISSGKISQREALQIIRQEKLNPDTSRIDDPEDCYSKGKGPKQLKTDQIQLTRF